jgi:hypothetical protein
MGYVKAICSAIANACRLAWEIFARKNEPDIVANERAKMIQAEREKALRAVEAGDINQIRKGAA